MHPREKLDAVKAAVKRRALNMPLCFSLYVTTENKKKNMTFSRTLNVPSDDQSISTLAEARVAKTLHMHSGHAVDRIMILWCFPWTEMSDQTQDHIGSILLGGRVVSWGLGEASREMVVYGLKQGRKRSKAKEKPSPAGRASSEAIAGFKAVTQA